jgi:CRP-like cAMP-binding protein
MFFRNTLLSRLPPQELEEIAPCLTELWLPADVRILGFDERPDYAYFPESAVVSVLAYGNNGRSCYIGLYGYEGFGSIAAALGIPTSFGDEIVQAAGYTYRIQTTNLRRLLETLPELRRIVHCYVHIFFMQISYTAFANGNTRIEQRLARWLLMYQDRMRTSSLAITHQRLSDLLGVRRSGITEALHVLEGNKLIRGQRGLIDILDRGRLADLSAGSYGPPEAEYKRLI